MRLDAAGKSCPIPVIMAKKELDNGTQDLSILVDGQTQIDNLTRLGKTYGREITVTKEGEKFVASFADGDGTIPETAHSFDEGSYAVFFNKEGLGAGDPELGMNLAKMAIFTLSESEKIPSYVLFMNGGVKLTTGVEPQIVDNLNTLIEKGCNVLVCGTCLNFYGTKEDCKVGTVSYMYDILGAMQSVNKVITL